MSIQITQTGGAGAAVADKGLSGAWLDVPITVTLSNEGANAYEHTVEDQTTGLEIAVSNEDERIATFTGSGNRGSARIRSGYREQSYSPWRYTYRVIRFERDVAGSDYYPAPPTLSESVAETAEARGYADQIDKLFEQTTSTLLVPIPQGAAQTLPDADTTLTSAKRSQGPVALTAVREYEVPDGTTVGERRTFTRRDPSIFEERYVDSAGRLAIVLARPGSVEGEWTGTTWRPIGPDIRDRTIYPEDFGEGVGIGDADADTAAIQAALDAISFVTAGTNKRVNTRLVFRAPQYLINETLTTTMPGGFNGASVEGVTAGRARAGSQLLWDGPTAAEKPAGATVQFVAPNILRLDAGTWTGFEIGDQIIVHGASAATNTGRWTIENLSGLDLTIDDTYQAVSNEAASANVRVLQWLPIIDLVGWQNTRVSRLEFDADFKASHCFASSINPNANGGSGAYASGNHWEDCTFFDALDHVDAAAFGCGTPHQPFAGSQCDTHSWTKCRFTRDFNAADPTGVSGVRFYDDANHEKFTFDECEWSCNFTHVKGGQFLTFKNAAFESCFAYDVDTASPILMNGCQTEHRFDHPGGRFIRNTAQGSETTIIGHIWQGFLPSDDIAVDVLGPLNIVGGKFSNQRAQRVVSSVSTAANTITIADSDWPNLPMDGSNNGTTQVEFIVDERGGARYPAPFEPHVRYWPVGISGTTTQTFGLALTQGGAAIDITSAGSGAMALSSPFRMLIQNGANGYGAANIVGAEFSHSIDRVPLANGVSNADLVSPSFAVNNPNSLARVVTQGCKGGFASAPQELKDVQSRYPGLAGTQFTAATFGGANELRKVGSFLTRGKNVISIRAGDIRTVDHYVYAPARCRIVSVLTRLKAAFTGPGLASLTFDAWDLTGAAGDMLAAPSNLMAAANTWNGLTAAQVGTVLAANPRGYCPTARMDLGVQLYFYLPISGCTHAQLTAGQLDVYIELDAFPDADSL